jgi:hypothetical protein
MLSLASLSLKMEAASFSKTSVNICRQNYVSSWTLSPWK